MDRVKRGGLSRKRINERYIGKAEEMKRDWIKKLSYAFVLYTYVTTGIQSAFQYKNEYFTLL